MLGEAIDAQLGHGGHEDAATSAVLRAAAGSCTGRKHYLDIASKVFDPGTSARAVREVLDQALGRGRARGTSMLLPRSEGQAGEKPPTAAILRA